MVRVVFSLNTPIPKSPWVDDGSLACVYYFVDDDAELTPSRGADEELPGDFFKPVNPQARAVLARRVTFPNLLYKDRSLVS